MIRTPPSQRELLRRTFASLRRRGVGGLVHVGLIPTVSYWVYYTPLVALAFVPLAPFFFAAFAYEEEWFFHVYMFLLYVPVALLLLPWFLFPAGMLRALWSERVDGVEPTAGATISGAIHEVKQTLTASALLVMPPVLAGTTVTFGLFSLFILAGWSVPSFVGMMAVQMTTMWLVGSVQLWVFPAVVLQGVPIARAVVLSWRFFLSHPGWSLRAAFVFSAVTSLASMLPLGWAVYGELLVQMYAACFTASEPMAPSTTEPSPVAQLG